LIDTVDDAQKLLDLDSFVVVSRCFSLQPKENRTSPLTSLRKTIPRTHSTHRHYSTTSHWFLLLSW